jgi:hypothetical protein
MEGGGGDRVQWNGEQEMQDTRMRMSSVTRMGVVGVLVLSSEV